MMRLSLVTAALLGLGTMTLVASCGSSGHGTTSHCDGGICADAPADRQAASPDAHLIPDTPSITSDVPSQADAFSGVDVRVADASQVESTLPVDSSTSYDALGLDDVGPDSPVLSLDVAMDFPAVADDGSMDVPHDGSSDTTGTGGVPGGGGASGTAGTTGTGGRTGTGGTTATSGSTGSGGTTGTGGTAAGAGMTGTGGTTAGSGGTTGTGGTGGTTTGTGGTTTGAGGATGSGGTTGGGGIAGTGGTTSTGGTSSPVPDAGTCSGPRWSVDSSANPIKLAFGSGTDFPQYGAINTSSSYARFVYGPSGGWGTSIILAPVFWTSDGQQHQGASIGVQPDIECDQLQLSFSGTLAGLTFTGILQLGAPTTDQLTAHVEMTTTGTVALATNRPGEAFKPVMLSSMHESDTSWDASSAIIGANSYTIPTDGWLVPSPIAATHFGLVGGTSTWKPNAPTVIIDLNGVSSPQVTGWVKQSLDPNDDNVGMWAATSQVLASWNYNITVTKAQ